MPVAARSIPLGSRVPWFRARTLDGAEVSPRSAQGRPLLMMFLCNHSPYVRHIEDHLSGTVQEFQAQGLYVIAASPNDPVAYPSDSRTRLLEQTRRAGFSFPYILDGEQEVARAFGASCTPEFFLYADMHKGGRLIYHGEYDSTRPGHGVAPTGEALKRAVSAVLTDKTFREDQTLAFGCSVKWKLGQDAAAALAVG